MFKYDWTLFNPRLGLIFAAGVLVVSVFSGRFAFDLTTAGLSAVLAWVTLIIAPDRPRRAHLAGLAAYLFVGLLLTWGASELTQDTATRIASTAAVTFLGYSLLIFGLHAFTSVVVLLVA